MNNLPERKSLRLNGYDYASDGWYFITICTKNRKCLFGRVDVGAPREAPVVDLNQYGRVVDNLWQTVPDHHPVRLDDYVIMPNHLHGILILTGGPRPAPTLGNIIGLFKSECTKTIRKEKQDSDFSVWQRNYYDRIIRNSNELFRIRKYINQNPVKWELDRNNPANFRT